MKLQPTTEYTDDTFDIRDNNEPWTENSKHKRVQTIDYR